MRVMALLVAVALLPACLTVPDDGARDMLVTADGDVAVEGAGGRLGTITGIDGELATDASGTDAGPGGLADADGALAPNAADQVSDLLRGRAAEAREARGVGFFGRILGGSAGPRSAPAATAGGPVTPACDLSRGDRGRQVAQFPTEGRARWRIYDTAPGSTAPRTQYITGFSDGCPRAITAALMVFGAPQVHETMRYDPSNPQAWSETDEAYEQIKRRVCGVRNRVPCPADRLDRLSRDMAFVTVYPDFGGTARQVEILLNDGTLVAQSLLGG